MSVNTNKAGTLQGVALILPIVLSVMGAVLLAPIVPQLMEQFKDIPNANYWVPSLLSVPALCIALFSAPAGYIADKFGRRRILIWSMFIYAFCGMAPLVLNDFVAIYISRIGVGLCEAVIMVASTTLIGDYFQNDQRDKWLGSQAATASFSAMCLFPIAGALGTFGWRGPFALYSVSLILVIGVIFFTWEVKGPKTKSEFKAQDVQSSNRAFPMAHMIKVCLISLVGAVMFYILQFNLGSALRAEFAVNSSLMTGIMLSIASLGVPIGAVFYRYAHKKFTLPKLIMLEFGLLAIGFICMSQAPNYQLFLAAGFLNQFGAGMVLPTMLTWAMRDLDLHNRGRGTGMWQATFAFGQFASTLSFAFVVTMTGSAIASFAVFGVVALVMCIGTAITLVLARNAQSSAAPHSVK
jgi:MFS family permease